jgi:6-phosphogluconolactonase
MTDIKTSRRTFLATTGAAAILPMATNVLAKPAAADLHFYVGTYVAQKGVTDGGKGLYPLTFSRVHKTWTLGDPDPAAQNVSFGVFSPKHKLYYLLDEQSDGKVGVYARGDKTWEKRRELSSRGDSPCYVSLDAHEQILAMANYTTGDVVFYQLDKGGMPIEPAMIRQNAGKGPDASRQEGPHAHCVKFAPDQTMIYSVDLGTDQILMYSFDAKTDKVGDAKVAFQAPGGVGPRHLAFHPNGRNAFVVCEMGNCVLALERQADGMFTLLQQISSVPADFTGHSQAAHLVLNTAGDRLYMSNRGHNSVGVFAIDPTGQLSLLQLSPTLGDWPRFFLMLEAEKQLVVAHQNGGTLVAFNIKADGTLSPTGQTLNVPIPVFIGAV